MNEAVSERDPKTGGGLFHSNAPKRATGERVEDSKVKFLLSSVENVQSLCCEGENRFSEDGGRAALTAKQENHKCSCEDKQQQKEKLLRDHPATNIAAESFGTGTNKKLLPNGGNVFFVALGTWGDVLPLFSVASRILQTRGCGNSGISKPISRLEVFFATHACWVNALISICGGCDVPSDVRLAAATYVCPSTPVQDKFTCFVSACEPPTSYRTYLSVGCLSPPQAHARAQRFRESSVEGEQALRKMATGGPLGAPSPLRRVSNVVRRFLWFVPLYSSPLLSEANPASLAFPCNEEEVIPLLQLLLGESSSIRGFPSNQDAARTSRATHIRKNCMSRAIKHPSVATCNEVLYGGRSSRANATAHNDQRDKGAGTAVYNGRARNFPAPGGSTSVLRGGKDKDSSSICVCNLFGAFWLHAAEAAGMGRLLIILSPLHMIRGPPKSVIDALCYQYPHLQLVGSCQGSRQGPPADKTKDISVQRLNKQEREERKQLPEGERGHDEEDLVDGAVVAVADWIDSVIWRPLSAADLNHWQWRLCMEDHDIFREHVLQLPPVLRARSNFKLGIQTSMNECRNNRGFTNISKMQASEKNLHSVAVVSRKDICAPPTKSAVVSETVPVIHLYDFSLFPDLAEQLPACALATGPAKFPQNIYAGRRDALRLFERKLKRDRGYCSSHSKISLSSRRRSASSVAHLKKVHANTTCLKNGSKYNCVSDSEAVCANVRRTHFSDAAEYRSLTHLRVQVTLLDDNGQKVPFSAPLSYHENCICALSQSKRSASAEPSHSVCGTTHPFELPVDDLHKLLGRAAADEICGKKLHYRTTNFAEKIESTGWLIYVSFGSMHARELRLLPSTTCLAAILARVGVLLDKRILLHAPFSSFELPHAHSSVTHGSNAAIESRRVTLEELQRKRSFAKKDPNWHCSSCKNKRIAAPVRHSEHLPLWRVIVLHSLVDISHLLQIHAFENPSEYYDEGSLRQQMWQSAEKTVTKSGESFVESQRIFCLITHASAGSGATFAACAGLTDSQSSGKAKRAFQQKDSLRADCQCRKSCGVYYERSKGWRARRSFDNNGSLSRTLPTHLILGKYPVSRQLPWLVLPFMYDQPLIAARLEARGLATVASDSLLDCFEELAELNLAPENVDRNTSLNASATIGFNGRGDEVYTSCRRDIARHGFLDDSSVNSTKYSTAIHPSTVRTVHYRGGGQGHRQERILRLQKRAIKLLVNEICASVQREGRKRHASFDLSDGLKKATYQVEENGVVYPLAFKKTKEERRFGVKNTSGYDEARTIDQVYSETGNAERSTSSDDVDSNLLSKGTYRECDRLIRNSLVSAEVLKAAGGDGALVAAWSVLAILQRHRSKTVVRFSPLAAT